MAKEKRLAYALDQVEQLTPEEKETVVLHLLEALNDDAASALHPAWSQEIERRVARFNAGGGRFIDAHHVSEKARQNNR